MTILCLLDIIHCILNIFLRSDSLNTNSSLKDGVFPCHVAESWALLPQVKHLGIELMHKSRWSITQVYNGQWTHVTESLTQRESSKETFFFHCAQRYAVWEAACHLWCKVTAKWPIQQCVLTTMNQTNFQLCMPGGLNLDIHILILIDIYYLNLYNNNILYWTSCTLRHIAGLIKQCQTNVDKCNPLIDIDKCSYPEASSKCLSSLRQLS